MPANGTYLICLTIATLALLLFLILVAKLHAFLALLISVDGHGTGLRHGAGQGAEVDSDRLRRRARFHRGSDRAGRDDRPLPGIFGRRPRAGGLAAAEVRQGSRGVGGAGRVLPGGPADLLRSRLHHPDPDRLEPDPRDQALAVVLRAADGGGADHDAFAGAAASRRRPPPRS